MFSRNALITSICLATFLFLQSAFADPQIELSAPGDIKLIGLERTASLATPIGRIELRWSRESEKLFGRTPERATIEAANAVGKALSQSSFPLKLKSMAPDWHIIFLSKDLRSGQIPSELISNCHPGWMTPPANIYIAAEQAAGSCGGSLPLDNRTADATLARVLIHEMGHVVEYTLAPHAPLERARAEGFATWFEVFAGKYSNLLDARAILSQQKSLALQRAAFSDQRFLGTAEDYALAAMMFHAFLKNRTIGDLSKVYDIANTNQVNFLQAVADATGWSESQFNEKLKAFLQD